MQPVRKEEIMKVLEKAYGKLTPYKKRMGNGPATYYEADGFKGKLGFISAVSDCFCDACNRIRLTSNGFLKLCLHSKKGIDLREILRSGISEEKVMHAIEKAMLSKPERHHFDDLDKEHLEDKMMSQIGG